MAGRKAVALANFSGDGVGDIVIEILQEAVDDAAKHARADFSDGFVDGDDAADFGGVGGRVFAANELNLRINHFEARGAVRIHVEFAVDDEALAFLEAAFEVAAVEEAGVNEAGFVLELHVKDRAAAASKTNGAAAAGSDFGENRGDLAGDGFGNRREAEAILVAEGKIGKKVGDG